MAKLLDLANELLLGIIEVIRVEDIEAFTSCNKRIHRLSQDVLQKHRAMKKKYSRVYFKSEDPYAPDVRFGVHSSVHPVTLLNEIVLDENVASYPTHLHIQDRMLWDYDNGPSSGISTETKDLVYSKMEHCPYFQRKELEWWKQEIDHLRKVPFDNALALLLTLLPNLQSIFSHGLRMFTDCTEHMVSQITKAHEVDKEQTHALSRLVSLYQNYGPDSYGEIASMSFYLPFTGLPSIRSVSGDTVDGRKSKNTGLPRTRDGIGDAEDISKTFKSGITNISFTQSRISSSVFEEFLCRIGALQDFKYEDDCGWSGEFQPGKIVNSLLTYAGHSLRCLDLTGKDRNAVESDWVYRWREDPDNLRESVGSEDDEAPLCYDFFIGSLRHFQVLKIVKVDNAMFIENSLNTNTDGKISSKVHRLVDLLPASIEKLALNEDLGFPSSIRMFDHLLESKAQVLPNLEEIKFHYFDPVVNDLEQGCHEIGVSLVIATTS